MNICNTVGRNTQPQKTDVSIFFVVFSATYNEKDDFLNEYIHIKSTGIW